MREYPSKWTPVGLYRERNCNVRIIDYFKIKKKLKRNVNNRFNASSLSKIPDDSISQNLDSSQTNSMDLDSNDSIPGEDATCSNILHNSISSADSICDYGEDITIERGILNWCDENEGGEETRPLDRPVFEAKDTLREFFPILWNKLPSTSNTTNPMNCEPPLWECDVTVVLSNEPIDACTLETDAKVGAKNKTSEV